ncbi:hypothetical protein [Emticicia fontis]
MGLLSGLLGLFGCGNTNQKDTSNGKQKDSIKDSITVRADQKEGFSEIRVGENINKALDIKEDSLYFLPIIRNFEENDEFSQLIVHEKLGKNIGAFIAKVTIRPNGNTRMNYVMKSDLVQYKITEKEVFDITFRNLKNAKLKIEGMNDTTTGDELVSITSQIGLATCILYDYKYIDKLKSNLKADKLYVTIINSGTVLLTKPNTSFEKSFEKIVSESTYNDVVTLDPATYLWTNHTLQLVKEYRK